MALLNFIEFDLFSYILKKVKVGLNVDHGGVFALVFFFLFFSTEVNAPISPVFFFPCFLEEVFPFCLFFFFEVNYSQFYGK